MTVELPSVVTASICAPGDVTQPSTRTRSSASSSSESAGPADTMRLTEAAVKVTESVGVGSTLASAPRVVSRAESMSSATSACSAWTVMANFIRSARSLGTGSACANRSRSWSRFAMSRASMASVCDVMSDRPSGVRAEGRPQLLEAAATGRADAADRHPQRLRDGGVVGAVGEGDDPEQLLAPRGEGRDVLPQHALTLGEDRLRLGVELLRRGLRHLLDAELASGTPGQAPDLALDDDDEPAEHCCRLVDRLGPVDELQEGRLDGVLARRRGAALGAGGVPQHRSHEVDELREPLALAREVGGERLAREGPEAVGCGGGRCHGRDLPMQVSSARLARLRMVGADTSV